MTPRFSISEALAAPFTLLKRKPLSLFLWGLLMTACVVAVYSLMIPMLASMPVGPGDGEAAMKEYVLRSQQMSLSINALTPVLYLMMLLVWTAAARATLSPGRGDAFAFLRIGMDEVRVAVVYVAWFVGWYAVFLIAVLIGAALCFALWFASQPAAIVTGCLYGLIVAVGATWLFLRLSLIAPVSFIVKDFAFVQGWALTRGQVLRLLGLNLLRWLISIVMALGLCLVVAAILAAGYFGQGLSWPQDIETLADLEPLARAMLVPGSIALIPFALFYGWAIALSASPMIVAARQLLEGGPLRSLAAVDSAPAVQAAPGAVEAPAAEAAPGAAAVAPVTTTGGDTTVQGAPQPPDAPSAAASQGEDSAPADPLDKT